MMRLWERHLALPAPSTLLAMGAVSVIYFLLGRFSLQFAILPGKVSALSPATGFSVAVCLIYGYRFWPAILAGAMMVIMSTTVDAGTSLLVAIGETGEVLLTTWLIRHRTSIGRFFLNGEDVVKFVAFAFFSALLFSSFGVATLYFTGYLTSNNYGQNWVTWFLGDLTGIALVTPALITTYHRSTLAWDRAKLAELALFSLSLTLCGMYVFISNSLPLLFLFLPFITWLAFRFTQNEVTKINLLLAAFVMVATANGLGPLATLPVNVALLVLQLFVSVLGITGLALTVTVDAQRRTATHLKQLQDKLESEVEQRTAELKESNEALQRDIAVRIKTEQALVAKEKQLEEAQRLAHLGSWEWDVASDHMVMSKEMQRIYGVPAEEKDMLTYARYLQYFLPEECVLVDEVVHRALATKQPFSYEHHVVRPDGVIRYSQCLGETEVDDAGNPVRLYGTAHDLTEAKALEKALRDAEELYRKLVEVSPNAIYVLCDERYVFSNAAGLKLVGATHAEELHGRRFLDFVSPELREAIGSKLQHLTHTENLASTEGKAIRLDGTVIDIELAATPFRIKNAQQVLLVARDISDRKKAEQQIFHLAHHDTLTGLANRVLFEQSLEHAINQSHRANRSLAVLFIDLDRFKSVNDTLGHSAGDHVLRECAQRMRECLRESDTVARAGGDEFLILVESISDPLNVPSIARKIIAALKQPFFVDGKEFNIGASIGISTYPDDGADVSTLIKHADIAMYRAKTEGEGASYRYYSPAMTRSSSERYAIELALRHALERGEMELYYQPKISLHTGLMCGAEALIRWNHPEQGLLLPHRFVTIAEDMGLIAEIGLWAIREVCCRSREWQQLGLKGVRIAVNVAYSQFSDQAFFSKTEQLLRDFAVNPDILELEITETMAMENAERLMSTLQQLKQLGVHLSVDDFGTGYSSLAYLKRLPVDSVKVDRSFIKDLPTDNEDVAITHAVLALVHSLNRSVVAEGVETREQLRFLIENGCDEVQGFYFSPAVPEKEFRQMLANSRRFFDEVADAVA